MTAKHLLCIAALAMLPFSSGYAATSSVTGTVNNILIQNDATWGGCMISMSVNPRTKIGGCGNWWMSLSCSGDFADEVRAYRMLDQAQLAYAMNRQVTAHFTDAQKHNGYCVVYRIDLLP